ncbi:MAG: DUF1127 domain-containing protein [Hyphomicrobiaceae bacterium]|nr:DUF1127 domain-containing protein [Hyphomicrobiaceae bacterium]
MRTIAFVPSSTDASAVAAVIGRARIWWHRYRHWQRRRATIRVLHGLSDRTLNDIGLDRSEIESVAWRGSEDRMPRGDVRLRYPFP